MDLGAFSISLSVRDLQASRDFYRRLGFDDFGGDTNQNWLIMKNGNTVIGLFQGMFEGNILTFNPGWDQDASDLPHFTDIRDIQKELINRGLELETKIDDLTSGPAHLLLKDPDGNQIMLDQHR